MHGEIILASFNTNKAREIESIMSPVKVRCCADLGVDVDFDAVEDGDTYHENAKKKVEAVAALAGGVIVADDSGLEVDALGGRPGVLSARYGGAEISDPERYALLLDELRDVPGERRGARFVCVVAARFPGGEMQYFEGELRGVIASEPHGSNGFGYDPVVFLPGRGLTVAQIPASEKNQISHRAEAFRKLRAVLLGGRNP